MKTKKIVFGLGFLLLNSINLFGQGMNIKLEKLEYEMGAEIDLTFETQSKVDSISKVDLSVFDIISGPYLTTSSSTKAGKTENSYKIKYKITSYNTGKVKIIAPSIYTDGIAIKGDEISITITGEQLTNEQLTRLRFVVNTPKPKGTQRLVIKDDIGFIEIYGDISWGFVRDLSKNEIEEIKKISNIK